METANQPRVMSTLFLATLMTFLLFVALAQAVVTFHVVNRCPFPIWPASAPNTGHLVLEGGGFFLPPGQVKRVHSPNTWNGRFWARTGCNFTSPTGAACLTGDCAGKLACNGSIGLPPATLLEVSLQFDRSKPSFYDVSLVDGYNLPVSVSAKPLDPSCSVAGCGKSPLVACPAELQVVDGNGAVVACKSACLAFDVDVFCCRGDYNDPNKCKPSVYSKAFKDACPSYISYAFDSPSPLVRCQAKEYVVTFCPAKWSSSTVAGGFADS